MIRAGGVIFVSKSSKRMLLLLRSKSVSNPLTWGFAGGKVENEETILSGVSRELREELGYIPQYRKVIPIDVFNSLDQNFIYYSFIVMVDDEFVPIINEESAGYGWFNIWGLPKPIHPGAKAILMHPDFKRNYKEIIRDN